MGRPYQQLRAPNGKLIVGTVEILRGTAIIMGVTGVDADGKYTVEYDGYTEVDWDSEQTERTLNGEWRIFEDEDGVRWPESALEMVRE